MGVLSRLFVRRPLLANTASSGLLLAAGDAIQQGIEFRRGVHKETRYNWKRTGRMLAIGLVEGPPHYWWYTALDRLMPGRTPRVVRLKILADQLVAAPVFALTFFVGVDLLEGKTLKDGLLEFKRKFPEVYLFDWCIWPPTQWLNFTYVPERYRVLYVNVVTVVWDVFLSYSKHRDQPEPEEEGVAELALAQLRASQSRVTALESDGTDAEDSGLLESDRTDAADCGLLKSDGTDAADCGLLKSDQLGSANQAGGRPEDRCPPADSGGTESRGGTPGDRSERPHQDGTALADQLADRPARTEPCRRRATS